MLLSYLDDVQSKLCRFPFIDRELRRYRVTYHVIRIINISKNIIYIFNDSEIIKLPFALNITSGVIFEIRLATSINASPKAFTSTSSLVAPILDNAAATPRKSFYVSQYIANEIIHGKIYDVYI